jgi:mRNA interferase RelE/StbE
VASYNVLLKKSAAKELESVPGKADRQRIVDRIAALIENPRPIGIEKLSGKSEKDRIRQGDYRVVFEIDDKAGTVTIVKIGREDI